MTPERQAEIKSRIDQRFDQFSLDEARKVVSGEMTSRLAHPGFSILEQEFAEEYFNEKRDDLRSEIPGEKRLITEADGEVQRLYMLKQPRPPKGVNG